VVHWIFETGHVRHVDSGYVAGSGFDALILLNTVSSFVCWLSLSLSLSLSLLLLLLLLLFSLSLSLSETILSLYTHATCGIGAPTLIV
jgi:hypothetical protein